MKDLKTDFLVIGGGVVGLSLALEIQRSFNGSKVIIIEKESELAFHGSGRNSGVLHSGIYYHEDSLKAQFTKEGNELWQHYCLNKNLEYQKIGKLIVPKNEDEINSLWELKDRANRNNISVRVCEAKEIASIEENALSSFPALYVEETGVVNPVACMGALKSDFEKNGGTILFNEPFISRKSNYKVNTKNKVIEYQYLINSAGLYADKIAYQFGCSADYKIIPFKGLYLSSHRPETKLSTLIYPIPDLNYPFLGTHFTTTVGGYTKIGPTAMPAFWREQYDGLSRFSISEFISISAWGLNKITFDKDIRKLAVKEYMKLSKQKLVSDASKLLKRPHNHQHYSWHPAGIRAQLYDKKSKSLIMDFKYEQNENSLHILNAVSPAFTCAFAFSKYLTKKIEIL